MNELIIKRKQAKFRLEILENQLRTGASTKEEVDKARAAYQALCEGREVIEVTVAPTTSMQQAKKFDAAPKQYSEETKALLNEITGELHKLDAEKADLSNSLQTFASDQNAAHITSKILVLREKRFNLTDELRYVQTHGTRPSSAPMVPSNYEESLPRDKYELDRQMKNLKINVGKYQKRMKECSTTVKKQDYERKISIASIQLSRMETLFKTL